MGMMVLFAVIDSMDVSITPEQLETLERMVHAIETVSEDELKSLDPDDPEGNDVHPVDGTPRFSKGDVVAIALPVPPGMQSLAASHMFGVVAFEHRDGAAVV